MGLFGNKIDRTEKIIFEEQDGTTGKQVSDRIIAEQQAKRKMIRQNLYRKYRGQGKGIIESWKLAKAKASEMMLKPHRKHKRSKHKKHYYKSRHHKR